MKRLLFLIMLLVPTFGITLTAKEIVYLNNGSVIKGDIIEEVPGKSLKIKTSDGNIFVYEMDEIARIEKNVPSTNSFNSRHNKLDFYFGTGYNVATKGGSGSIPVDLTISKRFSPYLSAGLSTGIEIAPQSGARPLIPIMADVHGFLPLKSTGITPFGNLRIGYAVNTAESRTVTAGSGKYKTETTVKFPNYVVMSIMPGIRFPISNTADFDLAFGYEYYVTTGGSGGGSGAFAIRAGFNFHASTDPNHVKVKKPRTINPVWPSGLEVGIEANGFNDYGGSIQLGYKYSSRLSFALGFGWGITDWYDVPDFVTTYYSEPDCKGDSYSEENRYNYNGKYNSRLIKLYLRAQYRLSDRKFSPIASIDLGYCKDRTKDNTRWYTLGNSHHNIFEDYKQKPAGLIVRPAIGVSMRMGSNSYLELRAGYEFLPGVPSLTYSENERSYKYQSFKVHADGKSISGLFLGLSYKHTFSLFTRH